MKQKEVFNKIGVIIKELTDQYKYLETNPDDLNALELELFVANAHFLADHAEILNKLNAQANMARTVAKNEESVRKEKYFEPVVRQPEPEKPAPAPDLTPEEDKEPYSFIMEKPEVIRHELTAEDIPGFEEDEEADYAEPDEELLEEEVLEDEEEEVAALPPVPEKPQPLEIELPVKPIIAEQQRPAPTAVAELPEPEVAESEPKKTEVPVKEDMLTINQRISAQLSAGKGSAEQHALQPISDLKQAINLNDKMLYVKELFNGYSLAYSEAIEILNRFQSFEEADRFLNKNYVTKNNWESKKDAMAKFYTVLKRRYLS